MAPDGVEYTRSEFEAFYGDTDEWDAVCRERAAACGAVAVCEAYAVDLFAPPVLTQDLMLAVFGTVGTASGTGLSSSSAGAT